MSRGGASPGVFGDWLSCFTLALLALLLPTDLLVVADEYGSGENGSGTISVEPPGSSSESLLSTGECMPGWRSD